MEMNLWNEDFLLGPEWGLDLPVDQSNGQFGDLKKAGRLGGDEMFSFQPQDAVEHLFTESPTKDEGGILGMEWMESTDLGSYLDALGSSQDNLLPAVTLFEHSHSIAPEEPVIKTEPVSLQPITSFPELNVGKGQLILTEFDALQSPDSPEQVAPVSPEQVAPVIKIDTASSYVTPASETHESFKPFHLSTLDFLTDNTFDTVFIDEDNLSRLGDTHSLISLDNAVDLSSSVLSADDVDSMLSISSPVSPSNTSQSSIIESSPELYKVISTSSIEHSKRYSPYSRVKSTKETKSSRKTRAPAQPVPEHVIVEQVNKKDRKKLQNKNAAIRYRQKKKVEAVGIKSEEDQLEEVNKQLKTKVEDLQREIKYMKNLMEDVCRAKGLL